jgi:glutamyl/glutaminyl-tRNA synthetase
VVKFTPVSEPAKEQTYRGRLAPSPTGLMHLGHARTFWIAQQRVRSQAGIVVLRNEDLDRARCKPEFVSAMLEDLRWFGFQWQEGPDCGGPFGPYSQNQRQSYYLSAFQKLRAAGFVYPCTCSRQDVLRSLQAPHVGDDEPLYPGTCRPKSPDLPVEARDSGVSAARAPTGNTPPGTKVNWRFRVPDGETISFVDGHYGPQQFIAGKDLGDFVVWRHDGIPAYQLAVVVDDAAMRITEVVRGEDLLKSTARQLLLYRALATTPPRFYHCPLVTNETGVRLAKRHDALALRTLRQQGRTPEEIRSAWA